MGFPFFLFFFIFSFFFFSALWQHHLHVKEASDAVIHALYFLIYAYTFDISGVQYPQY